MATTIKMPQLGESVTEGTIERWLVKEGDQVAQYDPLFEVVTDKVNAEAKVVVNHALAGARGIGNGIDAAPGQALLRELVRGHFDNVGLGALGVVRANTRARLGLGLGLGFGRGFDLGSGGMYWLDHGAV